MYMEDEKTELKEKLTKEIKKEIIAFANSNGGRIIIGVNDDGKVIGVNDVKTDMECLSSMIKDGISSNLTYYTSINHEVVENKDVIVLTINEGPDKPYYLTDKGYTPSGVYLRSGNTKVPANDETIKKMIFDSFQLPYEELVSKEQSLHFKYLKEKFNEKDIPFNSNVKKTLKIVNIKGEYTNLGLMLSDECPFSIKYAMFEGITPFVFKDRKEFTGSLLKQVDEAEKYIDFYNKIRSTFSGFQRVDARDFPPFSIREALLNAIIHRDYYFSGSILVSLYDNRLEITSLGGLLKGMTLEDLYKGVSNTRNKNLANVFYRLDYVESFGTGIIKILESYRNFNMDPIFEFSDNTFKTILYNTNYVETIKSREISIIGQSQEEIIIDYLKKYNFITRQDIEKILNLSKTRSYELIERMINKGLIASVGNNKSTKYMLVQLK